MEWTDGGAQGLGACSAELYGETRELWAGRRPPARVEGLRKNMIDCSCRRCRIRAFERRTALFFAWPSADVEDSVVAWGPFYSCIPERTHGFASLRDEVRPLADLSLTPLLSLTQTLRPIDMPKMSHSSAVPTQKQQGEGRRKEMKRKKNRLPSHQRNKLRQDKRTCPQPATAVVIAHRATCPNPPIRNSFFPRQAS